MKCEDAQRFVTGLTFENPSPDVVEEARLHVLSCEECARFVAFNDQLEAVLGAEPSLDLPRFDQIRDGFVAAPRLHFPRPAWLRSRLAKRITFSTAAATVLTLVGFGLFSNAARAEGPWQRFDTMRKAVLGAKSRTLPVPRGGKVWLLIDGKLVQPDPSGTTVVDGPNGTRLHIITTTDPDKQNSPLESGAPSIRTGARPPTLSLDLDPGSYRTIVFGANSDTLVLSPKRGVGQRFLVNLNPRSALPVQFTLEQKMSGEWRKVRQVEVVL